MPLWRRCLCRCRQRAEETPEQKRIRELESIVEDLRQTMDQANQRIALIESSVPWVKTVEQLNASPAKTQWDEFVRKLDWRSPEQSGKSSPADSPEKLSQDPRHQESVKRCSSMG